MLNRITRKTIHALWRASMARSHRRFTRALGNCHETQQRCLQRIVSQNASCDFGREHSFNAIHSPSDFQAHLPLSEYEQYQPQIDQIARGKKDVLTSEDVLLFEPSSGTTSARKLIPYTASLKREFQAAINPWLVSLYSQFPAMSAGRAYWSISPPTQNHQEHYGQIRIGFDNDWEYLGRLGRMLYSRIAVVPSMEQMHTTHDFRVFTLASLLAADDLRLISIWSPSYLTTLLEWYAENQDEVLAGTQASSRRIADLKSMGTGAESFEEIWPCLSCISCWTHASSAQPAEQMKRFFPQTPIQPKGLLATEAFVSLPFAAEADPVLATQSHFFEFRSEAGDIRLAHELEKDSAYEVIVTTGGGLYRYELHDQILVTGHLGDTPTLRFLGKANHVSDLAGEKLNALHVATILDTLLAGLDVAFRMLAPDQDGETNCYTLYIETESELPGNLATQLDAALCENPNYRTCIELGQLTAARVFRVTTNAAAMYQARLAQTGQSHGDIKPAALSALGGWDKVFRGHWHT